MITAGARPQTAPYLWQMVDGCDGGSRGLCPLRLGASPIDPL